jgi:hypothetical protein
LLPRSLVRDLFIKVKLHPIKPTMIIGRFYWAYFGAIHEIIRMETRTKMIPHTA